MLLYFFSSSFFNFCCKTNIIYLFITRLCHLKKKKSLNLHPLLGNKLVNNIRIFILKPQRVYEEIINKRKEKKKEKK